MRLDPLHRATYTSVGQILSEDGPWASDTVSYNFDLNGNLTSDGLRTLEYDAENQLTNIYVPGQRRSAFVYDGKMRRRIRREYAWQVAAGNWQLTNEVRYIYDGNLVIQERDGNNVPLVSYTRGKDLSGSLEGAGGIGGLLARTDHSALLSQPSAAHAYYHADGNGNITALLNAGQTVVARYLYDPFGNIISQSGSLAEANLYRFSSKEFHVSSGLVYYLYRYYMPSIQRWPNRDPLGDFSFLAAYTRGMSSLAASHIEAQGLGNAYRFAFNNPERYLDPLGLSCMSDCLQDSLPSRCTLLGILGAIGTAFPAVPQAPASPPVASWIAILATQLFTDNLNAMVLAGLVAADVSAGAAGLGLGVISGTVTSCLDRCYGSGGPGTTTPPVIFVNAPPNIVISGRL